MQAVAAAGQSAKPGDYDASGALAIADAMIADDLVADALVAAGGWDFEIDCACDPQILTHPCDLQLCQDLCAAQQWYVGLAGQLESQIDTARADRKEAVDRARSAYSTSVATTGIVGTGCIGLVWAGVAVGAPLGGPPGIIVGAAIGAAFATGGCILAVNVEIDAAEQTRNEAIDAANDAYTIATAPLFQQLHEAELEYWFRIRQSQLAYLACNFPDLRPFLESIGLDDE